MPERDQIAGTSNEWLARLREPFPPEAIDKLPKGVDKNGTKSHCSVCGGYHARAAVHLDYAGHAAVTERLLDVDPLWTWEPFALAEDGSPLVINRGGSTAELWIKLTLCGLTRIGVGTASTSKAELSKELIGDAIRNAAMRFGVALELWKKDTPKRSEGVQGQQKQGPPSKTLDRGPVTLESLKAQEESGRLRIAQEEAEAANLQPKVEGHLAHGFTKLLMETPVGSAPKGIWADFVAALVAEAARENADIDWRRYTHGKGFNELTTMDLKGLVGDLQSAYAL